MRAQAAAAASPAVTFPTLQKSNFDETNANQRDFAMKRPPRLRR
jgi:hypothetical protein